MKHVFSRYCILAVSIFLSACDTSKIASNQEAKDLKWLSGTIVLYDLSDSVVLRMDVPYNRYGPSTVVESMVVISSCLVDKNGFFKLFLNEPPARLMISFSGRYTFSDSTVLLYPNDGFRLYYHNVRVGHINCAEKSALEDVYGGNYHVDYLFSDKDVVVTGVDTVLMASSIYMIDLKLVSGWNQIISRKVDYQNGLAIYRTFVDNTFYGKWHLNK